MKTANVYLVLGLCASMMAVGILLQRGCSKPKQVEVIKWLPVDLDSLKATMTPDTIQVPIEKQVTRIIRVPVLLTDTALVDSLTKAYEGQRHHYETLLAQLRGEDKTWGWEWGVVELDTKETVYVDSIQTPDFFHWWSISAEGPIKSYRYRILPFVQRVEVVKEIHPKAHRAGLLLGGQFQEGLIRPIYGAQYQYKFLHTSAAYIPKTDIYKPAFQVTFGATIGIK